jgi:lipopolysaccharide biosynthesis glycosyltransferase
MSSLNPHNCQKRVYHGRFLLSSQCSRKPWKDGWCKQHHPDSVVARIEAADKRYEEKRKESPWYKLAKALKRVAKLEAELTRFRSAHNLLRRGKE